MPEPREITDLDALKGLTHPLRRRLLRLLVQLGPATVTALADRVDGDPGRVSYHLRELNKHGFIEVAPELARDRRERWWRAVEGSWRFTSGGSADDPAALAASDAASHQMAVDAYERLGSYRANRSSFSPHWSDAAVSTYSYHRLTPDELRDMSGEIQEVLERWRERGKLDPATRPGKRPDDGRDNVFLFLHAFPEHP